MNTLTYKGYIGSVCFSEADNLFFGKIEGIDGLVNFEGESVGQLTQAFHEAVDDYIAYCQAEGLQTHKSFSGVLRLKIRPEVHSYLATMARQAGLSVNAFINQTLEQRVAMR